MIPLRSASGMDAYMQVHQMGSSIEEGRKHNEAKGRKVGHSTTYIRLCVESGGKMTDVDDQQGEPTRSDVENKQQNIPHPWPDL